MVKVLETFQKLLESESISSSGVSEQDALAILRYLNDTFALQTKIMPETCIGEESAPDSEPEVEETTPEPNGEEGENNRPFFG